MKTRALRLYGKNDLRLEEFELPAIGEDEILAHVISDSLCMSSYKAAVQGSDHKRVPNDIGKNPIIIGHEFCGEIVEVGEKWAGHYEPGQKFTVQPALNYKGRLDAPGYSYKYIGGDATYIIIPNEVMEARCLLPYYGDAFFYGSLSEPMSCIVGAFHANYHTTRGKYVHDMGRVGGGNLAILGGAGPMGIGCIDYAIHGDRKPGLVAVTDIDGARLDRAAEILTPEDAKRNGVDLIYINTAERADAEEYMLSLTGGGGFDDIFVMAPVRPVVEMADRIFGDNGCMNFFAGPTDTRFSATLNFYNVHYKFTHVVCISGGNTDDMIESIKLIEQGRINPASMITHIGGLNSAAYATLSLPNMPGGKKLIYTNIDMELTAISDFEEKGRTSPLFARLDEIVKRNNGLWCTEAEKYLLKSV